LQANTPKPMAQGTGTPQPKAPVIASGTGGPPLSTAVKASPVRPQAQKPKAKTGDELAPRPEGDEVLEPAVDDADADTDPGAKNAGGKNPGGKNTGGKNAGGSAGGGKAGGDKGEEALTDARQ